MSKKASSADNQQGSEHIMHYDVLRPSETIRQIPQMTKELVNLLGILFTDGCVSPKGVSSWRICFGNKSKILIDLFRDCVMKVFGLDKNRVRIGKSPDRFFQAKYWSGYEKQDILKLMISSYGNPAKIYNLSKFHLR